MQTHRITGYIQPILYLDTWRQHFADVFSRETFVDFITHQPLLWQCSHMYVIFKISVSKPLFPFMPEILCKERLQSPSLFSYFPQCYEGKHRPTHLDRVQILFVIFSEFPNLTSRPSLPDLNWSKNSISCMFPFFSAFIFSISAVKEALPGKRLFKSIISRSYVCLPRSSNYITWFWTKNFVNLKKKVFFFFFVLSQIGDFGNVNYLKNIWLVIVITLTLTNLFNETLTISFHSEQNNTDFQNCFKKFKRYQILSELLIATVIMAARPDSTVRTRSMTIFMSTKMYAFSK